jgi:hypothetical protein
MRWTPAGKARTDLILQARASLSTGGSLLYANRVSPFQRFMESMPAISGEFVSARFLFDGTRAKVVVNTILTILGRVIMRSDWILDVLADLKTFAEANNLPALAEQLDDTALVALTEISALDERMAGLSNGDQFAGESNTRAAGKG